MLMRLSSRRRRSTSSAPTATTSSHDPRHVDDLPRRRARCSRVRELPASAPDRRTRRRVPALNALSYWLFAFAGLVLMLSFFADGGAAKSGWTAYAPLSTQSPGSGQDLWILSMHILTAASLAGAINFIVTIHNMRTRGMSWTRMPLFVWSIYVFSWLLLATLPTLSAGLTMLLLDRGISIGGWEAQTNFFNAAEGGRRCSTSTPSGSSGTRRCTSWPSRPSGSSRGHPGLRAEADLRLQGGRSRQSRSGSSHFSSGHTMFTAPELAERVLHGHVDGHRRPDRREDLQLARDPLARET